MCLLVDDWLEGLSLSFLCSQRFFSGTRLYSLFSNTAECREIPEGKGRGWGEGPPYFFFLLFFSPLPNVIHETEEIIM